MFHKWGMQTKIAVAGGMCLFLTAVIIIVFAAMNMRGNALDNREQAIERAEQQSVEIGKKVASHVETRLEKALSTNKMLATMLQGAKNDDNELKMSRITVGSVLQTVLSNHPEYLAIFTYWSKDYDGLGKYKRIVYREGKDSFKEKELKSAEAVGTGSFLKRPSETKAPYVTDPLTYNLGGESRQMIAVSVPILIKDTFYGVVGAFLPVSGFQGIANDVENVFGGSGKISIISDQGRFIAVTDRSDLRGEHMKTIHSDFEQDLEIIRAGKQDVGIQEGEGDEEAAVEAIVPMSLGSLTPWSIGISAPKKVVTAKAEKQMRAAMGNIWTMSGIGLALAVLGLAVLWFIARSVARPIHRIIASLSESADQVNSASDQLSSSSQKLAEGSSEQASSLEETSSSLEEMSSQTKQNADNAKQAKQSRDEAYTSLQSAQQAMEETVQAMSRISSSGEEIGKVIKSIDDIAFQTNLLALNAAVEAARAGEAGKGFAVVAEEVRNLAQRTSEEAKNTQSMIESTVSEINSGSQLLDKTKEAFETVVSENKKVASLIDEISASSEEQAKGVEQVNNAVSEMDKVVQQNASDAEESSSAAEELSTQADELDRMVKQLEAIVGSGNHSAPEPQGGESRDSGDASLEQSRDRGDQARLPS
jgi:methyl-accepting chemotaxis protein